MIVGETPKFGAGFTFGQSWQGAKISAATRWRQEDPSVEMFQIISSYHTNVWMI